MNVDCCVCVRSVCRFGRVNARVFDVCARMPVALRWVCEPPACVCVCMSPRVCMCVLRLPHPKNSHTVCDPSESSAVCFPRKSVIGEVDFKSTGCPPASSPFPHTFRGYFNSFGSLCVVGGAKTPGLAPCVLDIVLKTLRTNQTRITPVTGAHTNPTLTSLHTFRTRVGTRARSKPGKHTLAGPWLVRRLRQTRLRETHPKTNVAGILVAGTAVHDSHNHRTQTSLRQRYRSNSLDFAPSPSTKHIDQFAMIQPQHRTKLT